MSQSLCSGSLSKESHICKAKQNESYSLAFGKRNFVIFVIYVCKCDCCCLSVCIFLFFFLIASALSNMEKNPSLFSHLPCSEYWQSEDNHCCDTLQYNLVFFDYFLNVQEENWPKATETIKKDH